jgi:hypothetical protein
LKVKAGAVIEMHTVEPLVPESCASEVEFATEKLKGIIRQALMKLWYS